MKIMLTVEFLKNNKLTYLNARYVQTKKNSQVESFYKNCSFKTVSNDLNKINFKLGLNSYKKSKINYIKVEEIGK